MGSISTQKYANGRKIDLLSRIFHYPEFQSTSEEQKSRLACRFILQSYTPGSLPCLQTAWTWPRGYFAVPSLPLAAAAPSLFDTDPANYWAIIHKYNAWEANDMFATINWLKTHYLQWSDSGRYWPDKAAVSLRPRTNGVVSVGDVMWIRRHVGL